MITHFCNHGGNSIFCQHKKLLAKCDGSWDITEHPMVYFNFCLVAFEHLSQDGTKSDKKAAMDQALYYVKASGEFGQVIWEWKVYMVRGTMWIMLKMYFAKEYAKDNDQDSLNALMAGYGNCQQTDWYR